MSSSILIVDDAAALAELFGNVVADRLGLRVEVAVAAAEVGSALERGPFDLALVDLSFPQEDASGIDVLAEINLSSPTTKLAITTQGDRWVADVLRDAWDLLPVETVLSKSAPLDYQLEMIRKLDAGESVPVDPAIESMLRRNTRPPRDRSDLVRLVPHQGHAKLWRALVNASHDVTYNQVVESTGLKLNTIKNYRAQLLPELRIHGLTDPSLREMQQFAWRCRALIQPLLEGVHQ